ncbi:MAG: hypothetical protein KGI80_06385 [Verrucomicrobiota bacterium]|nr:hypothetical protein [Verrucomicrobiota bacterium]
MAIIVEIDSITQARDHIRLHSLDSPDGRTEFLLNKLQPLTARATALNNEVQGIFQQLSTPQPLAVIQDLANKLQEKIALLKQIGSILDDVREIDEDLKQVDFLLIKPLPLIESEEAVLFRLERICLNVDALSSH